MRPKGYPVLGSLFFTSSNNLKLLNCLVCACTLRIHIIFAPSLLIKALTYTLGLKILRLYLFKIF